MIPNISENPRNRKTTKRGRKRFFNAAIHALRMRVERTFAREDKLTIQEGTCDETPFEGLRFPLSIRNWHFVTKMAQKSFLWSSGYGKTAGSSRQRKIPLCAR